MNGTTGFTIDDLARILREAAGESELETVAEDTAELTFDEIGYDSVALLETAGRIERELDIQLDDETVGEAKTPRLLLKLVNERLAADAA